MTDKTIIHLYIYKKLKENGQEQKLTYILSTFTKYLYKIPRKHYYQILKEMEEMGLIIKINQQRYKLLECNEELLKRLDYPLW